MSDFFVVNMIILLTIVLAAVINGLTGDLTFSVFIAFMIMVLEVCLANHCKAL